MIDTESWASITQLGGWGNAEKRMEKGETQKQKINHLKKHVLTPRILF